jgi:hypothetical protein
MATGTDWNAMVLGNNIDDYSFEELLSLSKGYFCLFWF